jgi:signal peptidase I
MEVHSFVYMPSLELCEQSVAASAAETAPADVHTTIPDLAVTDNPATEKLAADTLAGGKPSVNADLGPAAAPPVTAEPLAAAPPVAGEPAAKAAENEPGTHTAPVPAVRARRFWRVSTRRLIVLASIVLGMRIFVGEASVVPTASMEGTILVGDHLFMNKLLYGPEIPVVHWRLPMVKTIHRGEIIVFHYPRDPSETFLKRVTAVGGDRLEIRDGVLFVNSQPVQEPYAVHHAPLHNPQESWGPVVVPDGKLFVMGDNRDNSSDSRDWGFVPVGNVIGEPMFVYWSYDAPTARWLDENPGHRITFYASIAENFFSRTRWSRTGMLL